MNDPDLSQHGSASVARRRAVLAITAAAVFTLAACGSSEGQSADGVASVNDVGDDGAEASDTTAGETDSQLVYAEYEQCMKDEGVDMSELMGEAGGGNEVGDGGQVNATIPDDFDWDAMEAASEVCDPILEDFDPFADMSADEKAALDDYLAELQNCMTDKGFPDVVTGPGGGNAVGDEIDTDFTLPADTDFEALEVAFEECDQEVEVPQVLQDLEESMTSEP